MSSHMSSQCDIASFVLRFKPHVRHDEAGAPHVEWRGHIRHVQQDAEHCFTELHDAVRFIQEILAKTGSEADLTATALLAAAQAEEHD